MEDAEADVAVEAAAAAAVIGGATLGKSRNLLEDSRSRSSSSSSSSSSSNLANAVVAAIGRTAQLTTASQQMLRVETDAPFSDSELEPKGRQQQRRRRWRRLLNRAPKRMNPYQMKRP